MPFTLHGKIIIQKCWTYTVETKEKKRQRLEWDEDLPQELKQEVENWIADISDLKFFLQGTYLMTKAVDSSIHHLKKFGNCMGLWTLES